MKKKIAKSAVAKSPLNVVLDAITSYSKLIKLFILIFVLAVEVSELKL